MKDYFLTAIRLYVGSNLNWRSRFRGVRITKRNILVIFTLVLCMRLFFYASKDNLVLAKPLDPKEITPEMIDPMNRLKDEKVGDKFKKDICTNNDSKIMASEDKKENEEKKGKLDKDEVTEMVKGHPIEKMIPYICDRDKKTAAFLVAIARKESSWGLHAPHKNGRDCYNYWGYKGNYNLSPSGYSCFDSPEHAVEVVGGKIDQLIGKKVDTPERMVTWKCGSSCKGHSPESVQSWIGAVRQYWTKLLS